MRRAQPGLQIFGAALAVLVLAQLAYPQEGIRSKTEAIRKAPVGAISGWLETISDEGRFRILFPAAPQFDNEIVAARGLTVIEPNTSWSVHYSDIGRVLKANEPSFRKAYRDGLVGMVGPGKILVSQRDIYLHGKLGTEFVIGRPGVTSYMRAFLIGRRLYTLAAHRKAVDLAPGGDIPRDIRQFFDSFTCWE